MRAILIVCAARENAAAGPGSRANIWPNPHRLLALPSHFLSFHLTSSFTMRPNAPFQGRDVFPDSFIASGDQCVKAFLSGFPDPRRRSAHLHGRR